jgi:hypothetical protein
MMLSVKIAKICSDQRNHNLLLLLDLEAAHVAKHHLDFIGTASALVALFALFVFTPWINDGGK